jgi:hypothetical protein
VHCIPAKIPWQGIIHEIQCITLDGNLAVRHPWQIKDRERLAASAKVSIISSAPYKIDGFIDKDEFKNKSTTGFTSFATPDPPRARAAH